MRKSGVIAHISSLPSNNVCGTFGKEAYDFIDILKKCGFSYWQVLPFGITDKHGSPYLSCSSVGGNIDFIDLVQLYEEGLITKDELLSSKKMPRYFYPCPKNRLTKLTVLKKASERIKNKNEIIDYVRSIEGLNDFCIFLSSNIGDLFAHQYSQYLFHKQWQSLKQYANDKGIKVIGDIPFYVSPNSLDVKTHPYNFSVTPKGQIIEKAGVPPDYFSPTGQDWSCPVYNWHNMETDGFSWWKNRLAYNFSLFDCVRIDHFRAISAYWSIPYNAPNAAYGRWNDGPKMKFINIIKDIAKEKDVIAENLGHEDDESRQLLKDSGFLGMSVLQFAFDGNKSNPHLPCNYTPNSVAYTGTHDNNTLIGFLSSMDNYTRARVLDYVGLGDAYTNILFDELIQKMLYSESKLVVFPIQDILKLGSRYRMNTPGTVGKNWSFRLTDKFLNAIDAEKFLYMNNNAKR